MTDLRRRSTTRRRRTFPPWEERRTQSRPRLATSSWGCKSVGLNSTFYVDPCWWINVDTKAAICQNKIGLDSVYVGESGIGGSNTYHATVGNESNTTFLGEIGVTLVYEHGPHLTCEVGYRALCGSPAWPSPPRIMETNSGLLALGPVNVNSKNDVVYHGPHAGLTLRW